jgi:ATP-dependent helicase HrpA
MKFRLVDGEGRRVAVGDDIIGLKQQYGSKGQEVFTRIPTSDLEREGITRWDFDQLPESVDLTRGGIRLRGYPALVDRGDSVAIRVLDSEENAALAVRQGLRRLIMLHLQPDMRDLRKSLPGLDRMRLQYARAPQPEPTGAGKPIDLVDELIALILDLTFVEGRPILRSRQDFEQRLADNRPRLMTVAGEVCALAGRVLEQYHVIRQRLAGITQANWLPSVKDMQEQLDGLVFRGFLQQVPYHHLKDYPRYLRAAEMRAEKLFHAAGRDQERMREMAPLYRKWKERTESARAVGRQDPRLEEIGWLLEELRVSFFAQQLGTAVPISVMRIEARWKESGL